MTAAGIQSFAERIAIEEKNLERHLDWIGRHDSKSSVVLAVATGMLGFLASSIPSREAWTTTALMLGGLSVVLLALSFLFVHLGNYPRISGPPSLLYFGAVAALEFETYREKVTASMPEAYYEDLLRQCHVIAQIVTRKFWALQWAYRMLFSALLPWSACVMLFKLAQQ